ncbi:MAG: hypothetical protein ACE147_00150 [Candidatus Methylomirabilales bacterium]
MPQRSRAKGTRREGGFGAYRQQFQAMLDSIRREIAARESELSELKAQYDRVAGVLGGGAQASRPASAAAPRRGRRRRAKALDWKQVYASLPARFDLDTLSRHPSAGKRSKPHLYAIISRWKKEKKIAKDAAGGYRKVEAGAKAKPGPRPKASKPPAKAAAAKQESPTA